MRETIWYRCDPRGVGLMRLMQQVLALLIRHLRALLRSLLPLYLVGAVALYAAFYLQKSWFFEAFEFGEDVPRNVFLTGFVVPAVFFVMAGVGLCGLAVMWHRIVLVPKEAMFKTSSLGQYVFAFIILIIMLFFMVYLPSMVISLFILPYVFDSLAAVIALQVLNLAATLLASWLWLRAGLTLPDAALGESDLSISASMDLTSHRRLDILVVAVAQLAVVQFCLWIGDVMPASLWSMTQVILTLLWPVGPLIGLAALTVLYNEARAAGERVG